MKNGRNQFCPLRFRNFCQPLAKNVKICYNDTDSTAASPALCVVPPKMKGTFAMKDFWKGVRHGIPIALGYLSVSFGFGIFAVRLGLSVWEATLISMTNLTSAGQAAGVSIIAAGNSCLEMALTQLVINLRYGLMGISLSQKLDSSFTTPRRLVAAFGITDEIFAVASSQEGKISAWYLYGMIAIAFIGWSLGTFLGAAAGEILPTSLRDAVGLALYGMFIAIVVPPARKSIGVLTVVLAAAALSTLFYYCIPAVTSGFSVILCAIAAAVIGAVCFPVKEEQA